MNSIINRLLLISLVVFPALTGVVWADVTSGEVINTGNADKIEGLVPDFIIEWLKAGHMTIKVGQLEYDYRKFQPPKVLESLTANRGKYDLGKNKAILERATGKEYPRSITGFPFPEIRREDPMGGMKLIYNFRYGEISLGNYERDAVLFNYGADNKRDTKEYKMRFLQGVFDPNKSRYEYAWIKYFIAPYDWAGSPFLQLFSINPSTPMMAYFYIAPTRKTLRITAESNTSEVPVNQEASSDDTWAAGPSNVIQKGSYRIIEEREALVPYVGEKPYRLERNKKGRLGHAVARDEALLLGDEEPGWSGAPWAFANIIWIKTKVYIVEVEGHLDNYNFGTARAWIDTETFSHYFKEAPDRKGRPYHVNMFIQCGYETPDGKGFVNYRAGHICANVKNGRKSVLLNGTREGQECQAFIADMDMSIFTRSGYKRFGK